MIGGTLGGAPGAVVGRIVSDMVITAIDSAAHDEFRPNGVIKLGPHSNASENFDQAMALVSISDSSGAQHIVADYGKLSEEIRYLNKNQTYIGHSQLSKLLGIK